MPSVDAQKLTQFIWAVKRDDVERSDFSIGYVEKIEMSHCNFKKEEEPPFLFFNEKEGIIMFALINIVLSFLFCFLYMLSPNGRPTTTQICLLVTLSLLSLFLIPNSPTPVSSLGAVVLFSNFVVYGIICLATNITVLFGDPGFPVQCSHRFRVGDSEPELVFPWYECNFDHVKVNPEFILRFHQLRKQEYKTLIERIVFSYLQEYFYFKSVQSFITKEKGVKNGII